MIGFSAAELAQIRADIGELLPDTCDILSVSLTSDGMGGNTETWGTVTGGAAIPCRIDLDSQRGRELVSNASNTPFQNAIISMAYDETITNANRVRVGANYYNVTGVNLDQSWIGVRRVSVERVP